VLFKSEEVRHEYYTKVSVAEQFHLMEAFKSLSQSGLRITVESLSKDDKGELHIFLRVH